MSFLGGVFKSLINPATLLQLATGPAGWASLAMRTIMTSVAQQVIQQLGQKLGLPASVISMAQQAFSASSGTGDLGQQTIRQAVSGLAQQFGLSPLQQGRIERAANNTASTLDVMLQNMIKQAKSAAEAGEKEADSVSSLSKGGGFLRAIALALGQAADQKMGEMARLASDIKDQTASNSAFASGLGNDPSSGEQIKANANANKLGTMTSLLQAVSQELSILQNVISQTLRTVGEAQSTVARKG